jgi:hypothetical protein
MCSDDASVALVGPEMLINTHSAATYFVSFLIIGLFQFEYWILLIYLIHSGAACLQPHPQDHAHKIVYNNAVITKV